MRGAWLAAAALALAAGTFAQETPAVTLLGVDVRGNERTTATIVKYTSGLIEGKEIKPGDLAEAVKKLWESGLFGDAQIYVDREEPDGLYITVEVKENPVLGEVRLEGAKKKKWADFEEKAGLKPGQRLRPYQPTDAATVMRKIYAEDGYLKVVIDPELVDGKVPGTKDLVFRIAENRKVKTAEIRFNGNAAFSDRQLRRRMKETKTQKWYLFWRSPFDRKKFEEDLDLVIAYCRSQGYRDFTIVSDSASYSENGRKLFLDLEVYEGPKYYFNNVTWEGNRLFPVSELEGRLGIKKGQRYDEEEFDKAVHERVQGLYMDRGYIYSQVTPQVTPIGADSLDVNFAIVENQQVKVRKIDVAGNTKTRENVIRREFRIMPGDIFNRELLIRSAREAMILNYFANVVPDVVPVDEDEVDLLMTVEEKSSDKANASIGYAEQYGLTGGGGFEFNNLMGKGQQLIINYQEGTQYQFSQQQPSKYRNFSFSFADPMVRDTPNLLGFSLFYYLRGGSTVAFRVPLDREVRGASFRWGRRLRWPDNYFRSSWMLQGSQKVYRGSEEDLEQYVGGYRRTDGIGVTQVISRDSRNHPEFPSAGSVMQWTTALSGGPLGGNENYQKHQLRLDMYAQIVSKLVAYSSLEMGAMEKLTGRKGRPSLIPVDELFLMGGSGIPYGTMLRGYEESSVGPYDPVRYRPLGGNLMLRYTAEARFPFSENPVVYGLLFAEMGNVWRNFNEVDPLDLKRSAGLGVRMFMPMIGMIGFDYGYGLDDVPATRKSPEGWKFHILFGMPF